MNRGPAAPRPTRRARAATGCAIALLVVLPLVPGVFATGSPFGLIRVPVESIVVLLVLALVPWRMPRLAVATLFGAFVAIAVLLAGIDRGYQAALGMRFVPLDWPQLGDAYGVIAAAIGTTPASAMFTLAAAVIAAICAALAWAALRVDAAVRGFPRGHVALAAVTAAWIAFAAAAPPLGAAAPVAAAASTGSIGSALSRTVSALQTRALVAREIADDAFADVPADKLLAGLRGKDVVIVFVESYGRVALEGDGVSDGVQNVLRAAEDDLAGAGYSMRSAWLTSPTFGGVSWLAHATLQTGVWADAQAVYDQVVQSDRLSLSAAFGRAGWRTVSDVPSNTRPWEAGATFYGYDLLLDATNVGYRGPSFGYARIPDEYTLKHFADRVLADGEPPVMAEIDLVSSHTPWAPLPEPVPWAQIGDGSVYAEQAARSPSASEVWQDPASVRRAYGRSIEYALGALGSFLRNADDRDLVVIALGDHQPAAIVSGERASRDVPVSIIAKDPAVVDAIAGWGWSAGLRPDGESPVWPMDAFRDRFLAAFSAAR
ncbi:CDP-alcohol phosphatidyltransferase [Microbacterium sp. M3]|uniref:CDP-alcohol phosphatidyltransferase n=1 Tax=Microbacterium arthrosphaerae TaxID=792652 RepID=A0ABU4GXB1_9MICO|nr:MULTISPECIES: CDP-alcohol phosphatidyltransferase [Microbacterium]MDW4571722.1 CDP-alcohol phosphatidyltransferase [Microbacterium arthrosphaerae]MDW7605577.1 CDP-alcohol phosphatidyltransferase [Microbacterium sp. M3]